MQKSIHNLLAAGLLAVGALDSRFIHVVGAVPRPLHRPGRTS